MRRVFEALFAAPCRRKHAFVSACALSARLTQALGSAMREQCAGFPVCVQACGCALELDATNAKALYRRAQARLLPPSSGGFEQELALKDLTAAAKAEPDNVHVREQLRALKAQMAKQKSTVYQSSACKGFWACTSAGSSQSHSLASPMLPYTARPHVSVGLPAQIAAHNIMALNSLAFTI